MKAYLYGGGGGQAVKIKIAYSPLDLSGHDDWVRGIYIVRYAHQYVYLNAMYFMGELTIGKINYDSNKAPGFGSD